MAPRVPKAKKKLVAISVRLEVVTPDKLKKIILGLTKGTVDGLTTWTINFELHDREKKTDEFTKAVDLDVEVKVKNHAQAEKVAEKGLSSNQVKHLIGPGALAAERLKAGKTTAESAARTIERTLEK